MRILYVTPFFSPICGGVEAVLDTTSSTLARSGHTVRVLTSSLPGVPSLEEKGSLSIMRHRELDVPETGVVDANEFDFWKKGEFMTQVVSEFQPDVVHFHNYQMKQYSMFLWAFLSAFDGRCAIGRLNTIHNDADDQFSQYVLKYAPLNRVVSVTRKAAIQLMEVGVPPAKIEFVPNMVDVESFRRADGQEVRQMLGIDEDTPLILFPSRLVGREGNIFFGSSDGKGLNVLIHCLPELFDHVSDAKVLLLGNDPVFHDKVLECKRKIKSVVDKVGLEDKLLFFEQFVPNSMLPAIFAAADVVVSLSSRETFGMVFVEGMAAGKPVVGVNSSQGGVAEVVPDAFAGFLVPPDDPHSTARAISKLLLDPTLRATLGRNGIGWVKKHFDVSVVIPKLIEVYQRALLDVKQEKQPEIIPQYTSPRLPNFAEGNPQ